MKTTSYFARLLGIYLVFQLMSLFDLNAQTNYYFYVQFKDKNNTSYSLSNPSAYLSARAIARRTAFNIACDSTDLPVNVSYLQQITNLGIPVHNVSKWMNGATVMLTDSSKMSQVRALSFVKFVQYTGLLVAPPLAPSVKDKAKATFNYGIASGQINQLNGTNLHNEGFRGKGMVIGVIDAGFNNVDINPCFDSLRLQGRLLGTKDIINPTSNIFSEDTHGAMVLSTMTGNMPGQYLGTAPDASFWLIRTEYSPTEYKVETDFWCSGIEFADSVGVDLVNSSLGYYTFDDPSMSFSYSDMTGKVSRASRAATLASKKGIIVVVAAGNEGTSTWHYIGSPADADGIISVGSVTSTGVPSSFSSYGPSYDGRIKPEICATGSSSAVVNTIGTPTYSSGTSFASPTMCGMMACLLQKYKSMYSKTDIFTLLSSVFKTGNFFSNPTTQMGYGIPDFQQAELNLSIINNLLAVHKGSFMMAYNPAFKTINIRFIDNLNPKQSSVKIYSLTGTLVLNQLITDNSSYLQVDNLQSGVYIVSVSENEKTETRKMIIY